MCFVLERVLSREVAAEPLENELEAHDPVRRGARAAQLVPVGGEAHELDLAPEEAQGGEQVLGLLNMAAEVVLGVKDQKRRPHARRVGRRRDAQVSLDVLEEERAEVALEHPVEIARAESGDEVVPGPLGAAARNRSVCPTIQEVMKPPYEPQSTPSRSGSQKSKRRSASSVTAITSS